MTFNELDNSFLDQLHDAYSYESGMAHLLIFAASRMSDKDTTNCILTYVVDKNSQIRSLECSILEIGGCAEIKTPDMMLSLDEELGRHLETTPSLARDRILLRLLSPYEGFQTARYQMLAKWADEQGLNRLSETLSEYACHNARCWQAILEATSLRTSTSPKKIAA